MQFRGLVWALATLATASGGGATVWAQPVSQSVASSPLPPLLQRVANQAVAVHTSTLVRTSGRADAAMVARMDGLDAELRAARQALDALTTSSSSAGDEAEARLEAVRVRYQRETEALFTRLQLANDERDRYRQDLTSTLIAASPTELEAQRRFGDGDFSVFDPMEAATLARQGAVRVRQAAERRQEGVELRQLAQGYATMVARGAPGRTSAELLIRWDRAAASDPSDFWTHIQRAQLAQTVGNLARARAATTDAAKAATDDWDRSVVQIALGTIAQLQGDFGAAQRAYEASLMLSRRLVAAAPTETSLYSHLSDSLNRLGAIALERGDLVASGSAFNESLAINRRLLAADSSSVLLQSNVATSLLNFGNLATMRGDFVTASAAFKESLVLYRKIALADPGSVKSLQRVAISLEMVGSTAEQRGDFIAASTALEESLSLRRRLAAFDLSSAEAQRDLLVSLQGIGDIAVQRGDLARASIVFTESLDMARRLAAADTSSALVQGDVASVLDRIGNVAKLRNDFTLAGIAFGESLNISRQLSLTDPSSIFMQRNLIVALQKVGDIALKKNNIATAKASYDEALDIARHLVTADTSGVIILQVTLASTLSRVGQVAALSGQAGPAKRFFDESLAILRQVISDPAASIAAHEKLAEVLERMVESKVPGATWADVAAQWRSMKARGQLTASNEPKLIAAQRQAAQTRRPSR